MQSSRSRLWRKRLVCCFRPNLRRKISARARRGRDREGEVLVGGNWFGGRTAGRDRVWGGSTDSLRGGNMEIRGLDSSIDIEGVFQLWLRQLLRRDVFGGWRMRFGRYRA